VGDALRDFEENESMSEEEISDEFVDILNENAQLVVVYYDDNKKIADAEAYTYDDEGDYYPMIRFIYSDGSKVDAITYIQDELDNFIDELNDMINEINADYGVEIEPIDTSDM